MVNGKRFARLLAVAILAVAVIGAANCGKDEPTGVQRSMIIVFASGDAMIVRNGEELPAKVGMVVNENDVLKTTNGTVDLQTKNGSAVRIRNYTTVTISKLYGDGSADTRLSMKHGGLMASVQRKSSKENFTVTTPTAIAGVRGTTFTVESNEGEPARVKVIDGKVAMAPRVAALEKYSDEEIQANENLKKLKDLQSKQEVVLEERTEAVIEADVASKMEDLNNKIESGEVSDEEAVAMAATATKTLEAKDETVAMVRSEVTTEELAEKATLVTVDEDVASRAREGDESALEEMKRQRDAKQELVLNQIEEEASRTELKSEEEIRQHYNKLETLNLRNGDQMTGAVIAQTGNVLIVHTPKGVRRLKTSEVEFITYP